MIHERLRRLFFDKERDGRGGELPRLRGGLLLDDPPSAGGSETGNSQN